MKVVMVSCVFLASVILLFIDGISGMSVLDTRGAKKNRVRESKWTSWSNGNFAGSAISKTCPDDQIAVGLQWDEQGGYGLVDLNMVCANGLNFDFTNNRNGNQNSKQACSSGFKAIQGREQGGYGIVNANMQCSDSSNWRASNGNMNGGWNGALYCPSGWVITGMEVQEQSGYGIINFRARCTELRGGKKGE